MRPAQTLPSPQNKRNQLLILETQSLLQSHPPPPPPVSPPPAPPALTRPRALQPLRGAQNQRPHNSVRRRAEASRQRERVLPQIARSAARSGERERAERDGGGAEGARGAVAEGGGRGAEEVEGGG